MENLDSLWACDKSRLIKFFNDASSMDIEARLKYFREIFPFADSLPISLYLYNLQDRVIACNKTNLKLQGEKCFGDYLDNSMSQYCNRKRWPKEFADVWLKNNHFAIESGGIFCQENTMESNSVKMWSTRKDAIYTPDGVPMGIIGLTMPIAFKTERIHWDMVNKKVCLNIKTGMLVELSVREFTVLQGLLNGGTAQMIALKELISVKTVETYIMRIKEKLNCEKQRDITTLLIQAEMANDIIKFKLSPQVAAKQEHHRALK